KDNKDKSEQNQSKPTKKRKRQDKSKEISNDQSRISLIQQERKSKAKIEKQGLIVTSLQSSKAYLEV
ncbi:hypothetical protein Tco_1543357, partial [Tanacetum coccineum]